MTTPDDLRPLSWFAANPMRAAAPAAPAQPVQWAQHAEQYASVAATSTLGRPNPAQPAEPVVERAIACGAYRSMVPVESVYGHWTFTQEQLEAFSRACAQVQAPPPPQPEPLTDEQVWKNVEVMSCNAKAGLLMSDLMRLVRAVERAHGIAASQEQKP